MTHSARNSTALKEPHHVSHLGVSSDEHRAGGFAPVFLDTKTGRVYPSCFADGRPAPVHLLSSVPEYLVLRRDCSRRVIALKPSVRAGFARAGRFFSRDEAMLALGKSADH
jgi:hypothetical protein